MSASFVTQQIDYIESEVYKRIKPLGFRKHGRTLHRFVSGDISQVISFLQPDAEPEKYAVQMYPNRR